MALVSRAAIAGLVLAGGEGRRIGGAKALVPLDGRPLVQHAIDRLTPQVGTLWLSVRGAPGALAELGHKIVPDDRPDAAGPLAGIVAGLRLARATRHALLAVVPCDTPFLPDDLVAVLEGGLGSADVAIMADDDVHPTVSLWRTSTLAATEAALEAGRLRLRLVCRALGARQIRSPAHWPPLALFNVNTREDLVAASTPPLTTNDRDQTGEAC